MVSREMTAATVRFSPEARSRWFPNASPLLILALEDRLNAGREGIGIWFSGPGAERLLPGLVSERKRTFDQLFRSLQIPEGLSTPFWASLGGQVVVDRLVDGLLERRTARGVGE